jgi:hypothetical protein
MDVTFMAVLWNRRRMYPIPSLYASIIEKWIMWVSPLISFEVPL